MNAGDIAFFIPFTSNAADCRSGFSESLPVYVCTCHVLRQNCWTLAPDTNYPVSLCSMEM